MFIGLVVCFAAMFALMLLVDSRMRAAQAAREAAFLRVGFSDVVR